MRLPHQLLHDRTRVRERYALFPFEGFPPSSLPGWAGAEIRVQASPALGAKFAWYHLQLQAGGGTKQACDNRVETFFYVLSGAVLIVIDNDLPQRLTEGGFAFVPHSAGFRIDANQPSTVIMVRKVYESAVGVSTPRSIISNVSNVSPTAFLGNESAKLQLLLPDEPEFDLAMNVFEFDPGHGLPYIETHVMEHGLHFLSGKGMYFLDDTWMEVTAGDFIWMGPFCPQSFYATGPTPARYLYYKNVNRDVML